MLIDNIILFKDDNNYFAVFINNIKVYENNIGITSADDIKYTVLHNVNLFNNKINK